MKIIKWSNGEVIYESEKETLREAVIEAVKKGISLRGSDLRDSDLSGSNLSGSDLSGSDLSGSDLRLVKFYGKGGTTRIKTTQIPAFLEALGVLVEN
jgi:uncharacterized protein YjbI with pentapeptide repeats